MIVEDVELRELVPQVLSVLVRRGADFATAEDAVQEALIRAVSAWEEELPSDPTGWLITVAWRAFVDLARSDAAAIAALHADATCVDDTDWVQIVEWYDELLQFADTPIVRLNRAVAVGEAESAPAGLAALAEVDEHIPRRDAVAAHLHEKNGDLELAARLYADAAHNAPSLAERDHQMRQAARLNQMLRHHQ